MNTEINIGDRWLRSHQWNAFWLPRRPNSPVHPSRRHGRSCELGVRSIAFSALAVVEGIFRYAFRLWLGAVCAEQNHNCKERKLKSFLSLWLFVCTSTRSFAA